MDAGLLAVKALDRAKSRLAASLGDEARRGLARALFEDALSLCASTEAIRWWVVSDDDAVRSSAEGAGLASIADRGTGLNDAIALATATLLEAGAGSVIVLPSDIPLATAEDVRDILDTGANSEMVVVPSLGDGGTNALYLEPPGLIDPRFGPGSLAAHVAVAEARSLRCSVLPLPRLELDIDGDDDLKLLRERDPAGASHTARFLRSL